MMRKLLIILMIFGFTGLVSGQTPTDADYFLKEGIACYNRGMLEDARVEFENALLLDKGSFEARLWLAQVYMDLKLVSQASILLREAATQAPDHPKVLQLTEILGVVRGGNRRGSDPVMGEVLEDLTSSEQLRPYGLVIPEEKVRIKNPEIGFVLDREREADDYLEPEDSIDFEQFFKEKEGPLGEILKAEKNLGLGPAIDLYMEELAVNPRLAAEDDEGLLSRAMNMFSGRFERNPEIRDNRFYYGALLFINGGYEDAEKVLTPLKGQEGRFYARLQGIFAKLDAWRKAEDQRILMAKKAEEERKKLEALARQKEQSKKVDVWEELKRKRAGLDAGGSKAGTSGSSEGGGDAAPSEKAIAEVLHTQGYDLYKKGKLNEAIAKYNECLDKDEKNYECIYHLGLAWTDKGLSGEIGAFDRAIGYFQKVIAEDPSGKHRAEATSMIRDIEGAKDVMGE